MAFPKLVKIGLRQLIEGPYTNLFPKTPPVPVPKEFRGKPRYDREKCIGCGACVKVCPSGAVQLVEDLKAEDPKKKRKVEFYMGLCIFCYFCMEACPVDAISYGDEWILSSYDKFDDKLIVRDLPEREQAEKEG